MVLERLYFKKFNNTISIYYRPTHSYMMTIGLVGEWGERLKNLLSMPTNMFYKTIFDMGVRMPSESEFIVDKNCINNSRNDAEEWLAKAWSYDTKKVLDMMDIENTKDEIPFGYITSMINEKRKKDNENNPQSFFNSSIDNELCKREKEMEEEEINEEEEGEW